MKSIFSVEIKDVRELAALTQRLLQIIPKDSIILLSGDLAAGKTTLVSYFCQHLNLQMVQSPTYAIHQRYSNQSIVVDHFDLYRLEGEDELQASGFYDLLAEPADYNFIEWPERIGFEVFPLDAMVFRVSMVRQEDGIRRVELLGRG